MLQINWSTVAPDHWVIGGLIASVLWFAAGRQFMGEKNSAAGVTWQSIAVIIAIILFIQATISKEWIGMMAALIVAVLEIRSIIRRRHVSP